MTLLRRRAVRLAAAVIAAVPFLTVVAAVPANAASSSCTSTSKFWVGDYPFTMPSVGTNTGNVNCVLSKGNQSGAVSNLQKHLNSCYWSGSTAGMHRSVFSTALVVDGVYGSATAAALTAVQRYHSIGADGVYGPETRRTILFATDSFVCRAFGS
ncbi:peptidoglycan-binding domain-containing protein [Micromonospora sp. NPDC006766]|uniref:peptidoglycan-binding domain-containing protein n=1 Tax=Micromonospora sp. NPDC006766 TaxID=3154778 RepID=UPI003411BA42